MLFPLSFYIIAYLCTNIFFIFEYNTMNLKGEEFLKKFVVILLLIGLFITGVYVFRPKNDKNMTKVKVGEVTHSIFYAPQYVAAGLGYFEDEGIDVDIILTSGADKVTSAVLSGDVQIGFCGSEATIYVYNQGQKDYLVNFAGLTKKDGSFLVSRKKYENFKLSDLKGKKVIGGRSGDCLKEYN